MGCCFSKKRKKRKEPIPLIVRKDTSKFPEDTEPTQCEEVTVPGSKIKSSVSTKGCRELPTTEPTQHENVSAPVLKARSFASGKDYEEWLATEPTQHEDIAVPASKVRSSASVKEYQEWLTKMRQLFPETTEKTQSFEEEEKE